MKESLILQHKPELLGELAEVKHPSEYDEKSVQEFLEQVKLRSKRAESIPDEAFPMDFHVYKIQVSGVGEMEFGIDTIWNIFGGSYSGSKSRRMESSISSVETITLKSQNTVLRKGKHFGI